MSTDTGAHVSYDGLFATPLLSMMLPDPSALNASLKKVIAGRRASHPGIVRSNTLGWHSDADMAGWGGEAATYLIRAAIQMCTGATVHLEGDPQQANFDWGGQMWANVSPPGGGNDMHAHPGALWSIVYYVDDGFGESSGDAQGGELVLTDPRYPTNRMYMPEIGYRNADGTPHNPQHLVKPKTGLMVAFPSWLMHAVRPYQGTGERISIAINLMVKETGA